MWVKIAIGFRIIWSLKMGGYGSGRNDGRATIEATASIILDINSLVRNRVIVAGERRLAQVSIGEVFEGHITVNACLTGKPRVQLEGQAETFQHGRFFVSQNIYLTRVPTNFSGYRWMFLCPWLGCRAVKLYLPNGGKGFASRLAYGLSYQSQRETKLDLLMRKARNLERKLRVKDTSFSPAYSQRPKGMWRSTYKRLLKELEEAETQMDYAFCEHVRALLP